MTVMAVSKRPKVVFQEDRLGQALHHQQMAEDLLRRSERAGLFDVLMETRLATIANAHATLAVSYLLSWSELQAQETAEAS
jgi:hypothetical protein